MIRQVGVALGIALVVVGITSGQTQRSPATLDDLLAEVRGLRTDLNEASNAHMRSQLLTARLSLHEARSNTAVQQLTNVRQELAAGQLRLAPFAEQLRQALETNSQILAPLRNTVEQVQRRERELRAQEAEIARVLAAEESRGTELHSRLDALERALSR